MYRVILVDDEPLIRNGISRLIPWDTLQLVLCCVLENGAQALAYLRSNPVDIVITDIKMPIMDGIDLIKSAHAEKISVRFILLSGYEEFEYARTAMKYGITHYLLKPTNEEQIIEALTDICAELDSLSNEQIRVLRLERKAASVFLSEYLPGNKNTYQKYSANDIPYFCKLLTPDNSSCILALFLLPSCRDSLLLFSLENIVLEVFSGQTMLCHLTIENKIILMLPEISTEILIALAQKVTSGFLEFFSQTIFFVFSIPGVFLNLPSMYENMLSDLSMQIESASSSTQSTIERIKQTVSAQLSNPELSLKWIAHHSLFLNENYLSRLFYKSTGIKFNQYLTEARMERVKELLEQDPQVKVITLCEAVGLLNNPTYMSTLFKNYSGMTLTEYRKKHAGFLD